MQGESYEIFILTCIRTPSFRNLYRNLHCDYFVGYKFMERNDTHVGSMWKSVFRTRKSGTKTIRIGSKCICKRRIHEEKENNKPKKKKWMKKIMNPWFAKTCSRFLGVRNIYVCVCYREMFYICFSILLDV